MDDSTHVDLTSPEFAKRLASLVATARDRSGMSLRAAARASGGRFTKAELKAVEAGTYPLDGDAVEFISVLYGCDLGSILPNRRPVSVIKNSVRADGQMVSFDPNEPDALLGAYLQLVRTLRGMHRATPIDLRHQDIDVLARALGVSGDEVIDRLATLMGVSTSQRLAMAGLFTRGAVVVGLVGTAMAAGGGMTSRTGSGTTITASHSKTSVVAVLVRWPWSLLGLEGAVMGARR